MQKEKKRRQGGNLHNLHIRIPEEDYQKIAKACEKTEMSIAEYFTRLVKSDGYEELLQITEKISREPVPYKLEMSDEVKKTYDGIVEELNTCNSQTRKIGTNISTLIRDVRIGKVRMDDGNLHVIETVSKDLGKVMRTYHNIAMEILYGLTVAKDRPEVVQAWEETEQKSDTYRSGWYQNDLSRYLEEDGEA